MKKFLILCFTILALCNVKAQNRCVQQLLFDDFNSTTGWTQWGSTTSISGGTFNFLNTTGDHYDRQFKAVPGLTTNSNTIFARCKVYVKSGTSPGHHILTLFQDNTLDPVSYDNSQSYAPTTNDAICVDITAQYPYGNGTNPTDPTNLWQFNLRYKIGTTLVTCPAKINFPALQTPYYVQLERGGNNLKLSVFSDPNYTNNIPGSPICFSINGNMQPLGFVNLGVYTWASSVRELNGTIDSLSICQGTNTVACTPPCDPTCKLNLIVGGLAGSPFSCGNIIHLSCNKTYDFAPNLSCTSGSSSSILSTTLTDPSGNTPFWANTFISGNGNGTLFIPGGVTPGTYTLTFYFGNGGNVCDSCKFRLSIKCDSCNCTLSTTVSKKKIKCGDTLALNCGTTNAVNTTLSCNGDPNTHVINIKFFDVNGNTPSWLNANFLTNLGNGSLIIPAGTSGFYTLRYIWGKPCAPCDSCSYTLKIQCCGSLTVNAGPDIVKCTQSVQLNATTSGGLSPYTYSWNPTTGLSNPNISNPQCTATGTYTITVTDAVGCVKTDTVKITSGGLGCKAVSKEEMQKANNTVNKLQVVPNPYTNSFTISGLDNAASSLDILNADGKVISHYSNISLDENFGKELNAGVYLIKIFYKDGSFKTLKIIKE